VKKMNDQNGNEQKQGDLAQEILNRIATDADFRQQILDNPGETLARAGYTDGDDVSGYSLMSSLGRSVESPTVVVGPADPPITTGIDCPGGGGGGSPTTAMTCGSGSGNVDPITTIINCGGGSTSTVKPRPTAL
jgi:hypothetical protein